MVIIVGTDGLAKLKAEGRRKKGESKEGGEEGR